MDSSEDNFSSGSSFLLGSDTGESDSESGNEPCTTETARSAVTSEAAWAPDPTVNRNTLAFVGFQGLKKIPRGSTNKDYFSLVFTKEFYDLLLRETEKNSECTFLENPLCKDSRLAVTEQRRD
jgi:hypothetical protein